WKTGVSMADVNADGYLDIYVCYSGSGDEDERRNQLFINNGDLTFTERSKEFGLDDPGYGTQATFFDYDRDGDLDMYLLNHNIEDYKEVDLPHLKTTYDPLAADKLFRNDDGTFIDVSQTAGISGNPISYGLGVSLGDINNDGWLDIYVSNDYQENDYLYINNQDGTFTDRSATSFRHISNFSMGNDIADFNNDGLLDIITLDMLPESNERQKLLKDPDNYELYKASVANGFNAQFMRNMLQLNNGDGTFSEIGQLAGVSNTDWSWAPLFADFDNDGYKDLFVSNGYLRDYTNRDFLKYWGNYLIQKAVKMEESYLMELVQAMPSTLLKNYVFQNNRDLTFSNKTSDWGLDQDLLSNGAVYADLDNDGDLDLITNNVNEQASIFQNQSSDVQGNHFLDFELKGPQNNPNGIGARVAIYQSGKVQIHEQIPVRGFQSAVSPVVHFGLGKSENVDSAIVRWPTGEVTRHFALAANQRIKLDLLQLEPQDLSNPPDQDQYFELVKGLPIQYQHKDLHFNDFKRQPTIPFSYSQTGPQMAQADVNGDGLMDMFIGGDQGEPAHYYQQQPDGSFKELNSLIFQGDRDYSDVEAVFFDANGDGALDLYVTGGMYHDFQPHDPMLGDRLYINDGSGNFITRVELPTSANGKSCVRPYDFDQDGDMD
ncbi:MAG: VCBS repeat-containing protein, partial [Marinoscillum sp.]